ncbi:DUF7504 family protein [Natrialba swarupiae]|uniref:Uncharacterized protein n=1 Tax=Natrialba swarupiae TaxID=2448032 RepID=A0A5D5AQL9_9EURY|nr:hypothetical protein [Natrialba swarupiae]TYT63926.1 hypothetical protein FYC77_01580 [Natrialba swarupiae]
MNPTSPDAVDPPANVLLVDGESHGLGSCADLYHRGSIDALLTVSTGEARAEPPTRAAVDGPVESIVVGERHAETDDRGMSGGQQSITDPGDLSAIGTAILRWCARWSDSDRQIAICFDSIDGVLEYASPSETYQFAEALTSRLADAGVNAHFHFDPASQESQVASTLEEIFDEVVTLDGPEDDDREEEVAGEERSTETESDDGPLDRIAEERSFLTETATESQPEADKFVEATDAAVAAAFDDDRTDESVPSSERESDRELPEATDAVVAAAFEERRDDERPESGSTETDSTTDA